MSKRKAFRYVCLHRRKAYCFIKKKGEKNYGKKKQY